MSETKRTLKQILAFLATVSAFMVITLFPYGCANTTASPSGGPQDTIPPKLLVAIPDMNQTGVSTSLKKIELQFNEYVKLEKPNENIVLSPPSATKPTIRTKGKGIVVDLQDKLLPNTTYSLYFGNAIQDNNEGNPFPVFALSFSTGDRIDSLMISGLISHASTLLPVQNATVLLHTNSADTTLTTTLPVAVTRTDAYGYFVLRNLKDTLYSLYAITDDNNNYKYDRDGGESVGFLDSLVRPQKVMFPYAPEIQPYFAKDTAGLLRRPVETNVFLFKEPATRQVLSQYERKEHRALLLTFSAPGSQILQARIPDMDSTHIIEQHNYPRDSILLWLAAPSVPDTVTLQLTYMATNDSLKTWVPRTDTLLFFPFKEEEPKEDLQGPRQGPPSVKDKKNILEIEGKAVPEQIKEKGVLLKFASLPMSPDFTRGSMKRITPSNDTVPVTYSVQADSLNLLLYRIIPDSYIEGTQYTFTLPAQTLTDIYGRQNDSLTVVFKTLLSEDYAALHLQMQHVPSPLIVDLMNERRENVLRSTRVKTDTTVSFSYLKAGKYTIRITEDLNDNGFWDTGSSKERRQAERVRMFRLPSGESIIELKEKMELTQVIHVEQLLNQNVTLTVPTKQK